MHNSIWLSFIMFLVCAWNNSSLKVTDWMRNQEKHVWLHYHIDLKRESRVSECIAPSHWIHIIIWKEEKKIQLATRIWYDNGERTKKEKAKKNETKISCGHLFHIKTHSNIYQSFGSIELNSIHSFIHLFRQIPMNGKKIDEIKLSAKKISNKWCDAKWFNFPMMMILNILITKKRIYWIHCTHTHTY